MKLTRPQAARAETFASSADPLDRVAAASHRLAPKKLLRRLASDEDETVRSFVAGNLRTPRRVRRRLLSDPAWIVRICAQSTFDGRKVGALRTLTAEARATGGGLGFVAE